MSLLKIYKKSKITPAKNAVVEHLKNYLSTLTALTVENFKYVKHAENIEIKVDTRAFSLTTDAEEILNFKNTDNYNYVSIENQVAGETVGTRPVYYFVINKEWVAEYTVRLILKMDVLNTFEMGVDYVFNKKTNVLREHRDRFLNSFVYEDNKKYYRRNIDRIPEGLTPVLYKISEENVIDNKIDLDWFFMFKTEDDKQQPTRIKTFLVPSQEITVKAQAPTGYYFELSNDIISTTQSIVFSTQISNTINSGDVNIKFNNEDHIFDLKGVIWGFDFNGTDYTFYSYSADNYGTRFTTYYKHTKIENIPTGAKVVFNQAGYVLKTQKLETRTIEGLFPTDMIISGILRNKISDIVVNEEILTPEPDAKKINDIRSVDRSAPTLYKILKLPYASISFIIENNEILLPTYARATVVQWDDQPLIEKTYIEIKSDYLGAYINQLSSNLNAFEDFFTEVDILEDERNDDNESKLFNSNFYNKKFVYDSFAFVVKNENIPHSVIKDKTRDTKLNVRFVSTSTMTSRFLFDFKDYKSEIATEDFDHILSIQRNNEIPVFTDAYLEYLNNGYNYDVKTKERQQINAGVASGAQIVGAIASFALLPFTGGASAVAGGALLAGGVSLTTSSLTNITNTINSTAQAEANLNQKLAQLQNQSATVRSSDDVDIMSYYTENRLKQFKYSVSDNLKKHLADLFYYCGYATDEQKIPSTHTRLWFNFLQADAVLENQKNIPQEFLSLIVDKFKEGATIYHGNPEDLHFGDLTWDFEQVKANNEIWLYN